MMRLTSTEVTCVEQPDLEKQILDLIGELEAASSTMSRGLSNLDRLIPLALVTQLFAYMNRVYVIKKFS